MLRARFYTETPKEKGGRLYREGKVKLLSNDSYETTLSVNHTKVSFIKKTFSFNCFNPQCSLWRGDHNKTLCYHVESCKTYIKEEYKKRCENERTNMQ